MSFAGGGDVSLDGTRYKLAAVQEPIRMDLEPLYYPNLEIAGSVGAKSARPEIMFWSNDEFQGGEGVKFFTPDDPSTYYTGKGNGRNPGYMTATPLREDSSVHTALSENLVFARCTVGGGYFWVLSDSGNGTTTPHSRRLRYSTDVNTWSSSPFNGTRGGSNLGDPTTDPQAGRCLAADNRHLYIHTFDDTTVAGTTHTGTNRMYWLDMNDPTVDVYNMASDATSAPYAGLAVLSLTGSGSSGTSKLYAWTGQKLFSYDLSVLPDPIANSDIARTGPEYIASTDRFPATFHADIVATDTSVVMFMCVPDGKPSVYEFKDGVGRPIWTDFPGGFTATGITYSLGNVFLCGTQGTRGAVYGLNLTNMVPFFVGFLRGFDDLTQVVPKCIAPGLGTQVMVGCDSGEVFIIDFNESRVAISQLDQRASVGPCIDMATFKLYRVGVFLDSTADQTKASRWSPDDVPSTGAGNGGGDGTLTSGAWDFDLPFERKRLEAVRVISEPLSGAKTVQISYKDDETGSFHDLTTLPATTGAVTQVTTGDHIIAISTTGSEVYFRLLRGKVTVAGGAQVFSYTWAAKPVGYSRVFTLALSLEWMAPGKDDAAIRNSRPRPETIRAALRALRTNADVFTFIDGTDKITPGSTTSYTVSMEDYYDNVEELPQEARGSQSGTEGVAVIKLREAIVFG